jgi:xylulose-5-phosphate/fructose-6-phosphate phosphoketolase
MCRLAPATETVTATQILRAPPGGEGPRGGLVDLDGSGRSSPARDETGKFAQLFTGTVDVIPVARLPPGGDPPARAGPGPATGVEQGTATTPFDVTVGSTVSGYHLVMYAVNNARRLPREAVGVLEWCERRRIGREVCSCFSPSC